MIYLPIQFIHQWRSVIFLGGIFHALGEIDHIGYEAAQLILRLSHLSSRAVEIGFTTMGLLGRIATRDKRHSSIKVVRMNQRLSSLYENYRERVTGLSTRDANSINANIKQ